MILPKKANNLEQDHDLRENIVRLEPAYVSGHIRPDVPRHDEGYDEPQELLAIGSLGHMLAVGVDDAD